MLGRLDNLVRQFSTLPTAKVGFGPGHLFQPNPDIRAELTEFLKGHSFLFQVPDYVAFLERYCGASIHDHERGVVVDISGLAGVSLDLVAIPGPFVDDFGYGCFAHAERTTLDPSSGLKRTRYAYFGFDATGTRLGGVFQCAHNSGEEPSDWERGYISFLDWLEAVVTAQGDIVPK
jgi:hypothetical protein